MNPPTSQEKPITEHKPSVPRWAPAGLAVTALIGITLTFYHGLWWPGLVLSKRDAFRFFLPIKQYMIERLTAGELPQWFPYEALGRPFIGVAGIGVFHPFTALYFLLPVPDAYRASTLLSCLLAAVGAFALGRALRFSYAGALLAGIAFVCSGYIASLTENVTYQYSICLLPLFCAALEKALVEPRAWMAAPAVLWATVFLNGDVQTGYYYGFIALAWTIARAPGPRLDAYLRLVFVGSLAALLAGAQLGPTWVVFAGSERAHPAMFLEQAMDWSTHPLRLLTMLAAPVGGQADPVVVARVFFDTPIRGFLSESLYCGLPVMGLAVLGAWHRRDLRVLALLACLVSLLALGRFGGLYELFYHFVPFWSAFRYPEKLMGIVAFAIAILAGGGLDALRAGHGRLIPWLLVAILYGGIGAALRTDAASAWAAAHFEASAAVVDEVAGSAGLAFLYSAVAALGMWLVLVGARKGYLRETLVLGVVAAIVTLDLMRVNMGAYYTAPTAFATFSPPFAEAIRKLEGPLAPGRFRLVSIPEKILVWPTDLLDSLGFYGAGSVERRQALDLEHNAQFHLETVIPYLPGYSFLLAETLNSRSGLEAAARLNVAYYIGRRYHLRDPKLARTLVAQLPPYDLALFRNAVPAKPRAYLSRHPEWTANLGDPMVLLTRRDYLNGEVDVIETADPTLPGPALSGSAIIDRYVPEEVRVRVDTRQHAVLILLDAYDKGWTATNELGTDMPILRANALVRAVVVPSGTHVVTFRYETPFLRVGMALSLGGALLCLLLLVSSRWKTSHPRSLP